jgi:hypothetical protein
MVLAVAAAVALLGASCSPSASSYFPLSVGSVWNSEYYVLSGTTLASLDTIQTGSVVTTALEKATHSSGKEVIKFKYESTVHMRNPDTTMTGTTYSYILEEGDYYLGFSALDDTTADTLMPTDLSVGKTWNQGGASAEVVAEEDVTVKAGTYKKAAKVELASGVGGVTFDLYSWYAKGVGQVQSAYEYTYAGVTVKYRWELVSATIK